MKRKYDPATTDVPQVRHLPARRSPKECSKSGGVHEWIAGDLEVFAACPQYFERHGYAPGGWETIVCVLCQWGRLLPASRVPATGKVRLCVECDLPYVLRQFGNKRQVRCPSCQHWYRVDVKRVREGVERLAELGPPLCIDCGALVANRHAKRCKPCDDRVDRRYDREYQKRKRKARRAA